MDIKHFVFKGNTVHFDSYRAGVFYYNVKSFLGEWFQFQVPIEDIGNATLMATDKALTYMRWIRKAIEAGTFIKMTAPVPATEGNG